MSRMSITTRSMQRSIIAEGDDIDAYFYFPSKSATDKNEKGEKDKRCEGRCKRFPSSALYSVLFFFTFYRFCLRALVRRSLPVQRVVSSFFERYHVLFSDDEIKTI